MVSNITNMIRSNKELTANISHELRSPLTRIRITEDMILEELEKIENENLKNYIISNQTEIDNMDTLIGKILSISKLDLGIDKSKDEKIDLKELFNEVINSYEDYFIKEEKELKINFTEKNIILNGNREEIGWLFSNIIHNSLKYSDSNIIELSLKKIKNNLCEIIISNENQNLNSLKLDKIFDPFYRNLKENYKIGTGLGLTIVKKIIDNHKGKIKVDLNNNNKFNLTINLKI